MKKILNGIIQLITIAIVFYLYFKLIYSPLDDNLFRILLVSMLSTAFLIKHIEIRLSELKEELQNNKIIKTSQKSKLSKENQFLITTSVSILMLAVTIIALLLKKQ